MTAQLNLFPTALESIIVTLPKHLIEFVLAKYGADVHVVGSRLTEDGIELVLEGDAVQVSEVLYVLDMFAVL